MRCRINGDVDSALRPLLVLSRNTENVFFYAHIKNYILHSDSDLSLTSQWHEGEGENKRQTIN
jgi:hypothetical protein